MAPDTPDPIRFDLETPEGMISVEWHGGNYISVWIGGFHEVINVWDYDADRSMVAFTPTACAVRVARWVAEQDDGWHAHYTANA